MLSPTPNRTQLGQAEMEANPTWVKLLKVGRVIVGGRAVTRRNGRFVN
jgi:hypothetical protein